MKIACCAVVLLASISSSAFAASFTVNSTRDAVDVLPGDAVCSTGGTIPGGAAECTLRAAVQEANSVGSPRGVVHEIHVPAGVYVLTRRVIAPETEETNQERGHFESHFTVQTGDLDIASSLTITGDGPGLTIIDGDNRDRVFDIVGHARWVTLFQLTVRNGRTTTPGGCINHRGTFTYVFLVDTHVEGCVAHDRAGGGMYSNGFTEMIRATFRDNTANRGGGFENSDVARISESSFIDNRAWPSSFSVGGGGAISNISLFGRVPILDLQSSTLSGNFANVGAGLLNRGAAAVRNSTISGNQGDGITFAFSASGPGRGHEELALYHATIVDNDRNGIGRGTGLPFQISHTIVARNGLHAGTSNCSGGYTNGSYNLDDGTSCGFAGTGDMSSTDPLLGPLADNGGPTLTHALASGSPAIDASIPRGSLHFDQRGMPRPWGAGADIGAYEWGFDLSLLFTRLEFGFADLFRVELVAPTTMSVDFTLDGGDGDKQGLAQARILGVKAADGQTQLKYVLDKDGRRLSVSGVAMPPKPGDQTNVKPAVLFYLDLQRPLHGSARLRVESACAECAAKAGKKSTIVVQAYQPEK